MVMLKVYNLLETVIFYGIQIDRVEVETLYVNMKFKVSEHEGKL